MRHPGRWQGGGQPSRWRPVTMTDDPLCLLLPLIHVPHCPSILPDVRPAVWDVCLANMAPQPAFPLVIPAPFQTHLTSTHAASQSRPALMGRSTEGLVT